MSAEMNTGDEKDKRSEKSPEGGGLLSHEAMVGHYVSAFITSSNRVRYVTIAVTIASIILLVGHWNNRPTSWFNSRVGIARAALTPEVWQFHRGLVLGPLPEPQQRAATWLSLKGLQTKEQVESYLTMAETARVESLLLPEMPFFGVRFDINDLGFFGGASLGILMLMLTFAMARQHENLYLTMWKVEKIWEREGSPLEDNDSYANLVYHTVAMSQQFSRPPTLARWKLSALGSLSRVLLMGPFLVQSFGFYQDFRTRHYGFILNPPGVYSSLTAQAVALLVTLLLTAVCLFYSFSNDKRWQRTFFTINSGWGAKFEPSWREWAHVTPSWAIRHAVKSAETEAEVRARVFAYDNWPKWGVGIENVRSSGELQAGAQVHVESSLCRPPLVFVVNELAVAGREPDGPTRLVITAALPGCQLKISQEISRHGSGVVWSQRVSLRGIATWRYRGRLRELLEARSAGTGLGVAMQSLLARPPAPRFLPDATGADHHVGGTDLTSPAPPPQSASSPAPGGRR